MLQIPRVFPRVSYLGNAKAVQCPRPGPKIGDKSQQIPRYSPICPRGQPPGWPLISALRKNCRGEVIRVRMGIFTTALRNKNRGQILIKNTSPYFTVHCLLSSRLLR